MAEKGEEKAKEKEAAKKGEGSADREAGESPGPAPLGGGDQKPNFAAGSKVGDVSDEGDPGLGRGDQARRVRRRETVDGGDGEPGA